MANQVQESLKRALIYPSSPDKELQATLENYIFKPVTQELIAKTVAKFVKRTNELFTTITAARNPHEAPVCNAKMESFEDNIRLWQFEKGLQPIESSLCEIWEAFFSTLERAPDTHAREALEELFKAIRGQPAPQTETSRRFQNTCCFYQWLYPDRTYFS